MVHRMSVIYLMYVNVINNTGIISLHTQLDIETSAVTVEHKEEDFFASIVTGSQQQQDVISSSSTTCVNNQGVYVLSNFLIKAL